MLAHTTAWVQGGAGPSLGFSQDGCTNFPDRYWGSIWKSLPSKNPIFGLFTHYSILFIFERWFTLSFGVLFLLFTSIAPLSGRVPCTRCQISAGARAPVAPALTRALLQHKQGFVESQFLSTHYTYVTMCENDYICKQRIYF